MFIEKLIIAKGDGDIIRNIVFHEGLNLIIDETHTGNIKQTGNSVGKTTVLKLIDFCLAGNIKSIYTDNENKKQYTLVKDFLENNNVIITLILAEKLNDPKARRIVIRRNFLARTKTIREINNKAFTEDDFENELKKELFPNLLSDKPTFRQVIAHNIRWQDESINNTLKVLYKYTTDVEYESLYLYLFNCNYNDGQRRQQLISKISEETTFKNKLEKKQTRSAYEAMLVVVENEIEKLLKIKSRFVYNGELEKDIGKLNELKICISKVNTEITALNIRKDIIYTAIKELEENRFKVDMSVLKSIFEQTKKHVGTLHKTFEELVDYHNKMIFSKVRFIKDQLPPIEQQLNEKNNLLVSLLRQDKLLSDAISKSKTLAEMEHIIALLNEQYRKKGEYENIIEQISDAENTLRTYNEELSAVDKLLFSLSFEEKIKLQLKKFNRIFADVSNRLYAEQYAITYTRHINNKGMKLYKFDCFNTNMSPGKKQGEIFCFDIAYSLFAEQEKIDSLKFLLSDKKELMHDNQLLNIASFVNENNIQFIVPILRDKLPQELAIPKYDILRLSQQNKLFKIECDS
jgi:uncharacterized protein YydD (DUF2326 family)